MQTNCHMPAEWEPQEAIWLAWPHNEDDWPGKLNAVRWAFTEIIRHIAEGQKVCLLVQNQAEQDSAIAMLDSASCKLGNVECYHMATNRGWLRDSGPTFVRDDKGAPVLLDWRFNAWAKYDDWPLDNKVPQNIAQARGAELLTATYNDKQVVLEGGAIDVNGNGLLLATKECLLDAKVQTRNPGFTETDYKNIFEQYLGVNEIIWLEKGIVGDDTHGHIDDIARFVGEHKILAAIENNKSDDNYEILKQNFKLLEGYKTKKGKALEVVELPMPKAVYFNGERLPASYANFLICNGVVLVPTFNDPNDRVALNIIAECFSGREVIGIHSVDIILGLGTLHCLSQQQPKF